MNEATYMQHLGAISWHLELLVTQSKQDNLSLTEIYSQVQQLINSKGKR